MNSRTYNITTEFVAACHLLEVDLGRVLQRMGLPSNLPRIGLNLSAKQVGLAFAELIGEYGRDDIHIRVADGFAKAAFGHAFLALQCSETLRKGIRRTAHFKMLMEPVEWLISESADNFQIELRALSEDFPPMGIFQITGFLWLVKCCRNVTARNVTPTRVSITDAVPHQALIEAELGCTIDVSNQAILEFPASLMDLPILSSNAQVISSLQAHDQTSSEEPLIASIQSAILKLLPSGAVTLDRVAPRLALSKRTLERRLSERDTSFKELVRACRIDAAQRYLSESRMPIEEISLLLGYKETNSFYRAFKAWHGQTPQDLRTKALE